MSGLPTLPPTPTTAEALSEAPTRVSSLANDLSSLAVKTPYGTSDEGLTKTFEYRRFLSAAADGKRLSYWHDVPMKAASGAGVVHAVIEITRKTKAKMEIATDEKGTPIKQDIKKGKLRDYNIPIDWNYGAIPQTWEEPEHEWKGLEGHQGDNDPVDVVDLSTIDVPCGAVIEFKPIAALAMIDEGEVDWKVVGLNMADPLAETIDSLEALEKAMPGQVDAVREWFTWYKATDPETLARDESKKNVFGFEGKPLDTATTMDIIEVAHESWANLVLRKVPAKKLQLA